jgi:hypothetical protein
MTSDTNATQQASSAAPREEISCTPECSPSEEFTLCSTPSHGASEVYYDPEAASSPRPRQTNIFAQWLCNRFEWTHYLTLTKNPLAVYARRQSVDAGLAFKSEVEEYFRILSSDVYGRKKFCDNFVKHATFFENLSKYGNPTAWHAHSLVYVAQPFADRFVKKAKSCWTRRVSNRPDAITIESLAHCNLRVVDYCLKHDGTDAGIEPLFSGELENIK